MRKLLFVMMSVIIILAISNCNGGGAESGYDPNDTIPRATALAMYSHYMDPGVDKSDSAIIRQIYPPVASLKHVLKTNHLKGIKFMIGAYLDTDPVIARRNQPMVMMQLKIQKGGTTTYLYYDLNSLTTKLAPLPPYCPPPPGCVTPEES